MTRFGFVDDDHRRAFELSREDVRFGGPNQRRCGARTRSGHFCQKTPLTGEIRCLAHGGPAVARRYRASQIEALRRGELSQAEFDRSEAKRAANRLRDRWKRDPWAPGSTLDLGEHEVTFLRDLTYAGHDVQALPPAVADTARWRWRRLCLDRARHEEWRVFCQTELRARIERAGCRPRHDGADGWDRQIAPAFSVSAPPGAYSKRTKLDQKPTEGTVTERGPKTPKRWGRSIAGINPDTFVGVFASHGDVIRRVTGDDADEDEIIRVAALLTRVLAAPDDTEAASDWREMVMLQKFGQKEG